MDNARICLTHNDADELLESAALSEAEFDSTALQARDFCANTDLIAKIAEESGFRSGHLNVLVGEKDNRRDAKNLVCHCFTGKLPSGSVLHVEDDTYVASAALNLLLQADDLHFVNLCQMLGRYLGTFSPARALERQSKLVERAPLVSEEDVCEFLSAVGSVSGSGALREALRYTCGGAASPQEVNLQLALCLPARCNGYAIQKPSMNYKVDIGAEGAAFYDTESIRIDLCWPKAHFGLEYMGEEEHRNRMLEDIARWYAAQSEGFELWYVTKRQLEDAEQMEFIARKVARRTRKKVVEGTWPTTDETQRLLDVLMGRRTPTIGENLRTRRQRAPRRGER